MMCTLGRKLHSLSARLYRTCSALLPLALDAGMTWLHACTSGHMQVHLLNVILDLQFSHQLLLVAARMHAIVYAL